jgi:nitrite reductase/ring-hydroxylating ferredoxin subunit
MSEYQKVATIDELSPGGRLSLVFDDRSVILFQIGADFYAVEDVCSHDGSKGPRLNARGTEPGSTSAPAGRSACPPWSRSKCSTSNSRGGTS